MQEVIRSERFVAAQQRFGAAVFRPQPYLGRKRCVGVFLRDAARVSD